MNQPVDDVSLLQAQVARLKYALEQILGVRALAGDADAACDEIENIARDALKQKG